MKRIVLVLKSGGDFNFDDVRLLQMHINGLWQSGVSYEIVCFWDKVKKIMDLGNLKLYPLTNNLKGTWSRMELYKPENAFLRPFLYIDLDTVILDSVEVLFNLIEKGNLKDKFICLEDFYQKNQLATGLVWFPNNKKVDQVWKAFKAPIGRRMDYFLRGVIKPDFYWQQLTNHIVSSKPKPKKQFINQPNKNDKFICFHGKPRIRKALNYDWVNNYVNKNYNKPLVTVIIPYKINRGWLQEAIDSVPEDVQLIVSQGEGNWPENFNKVFNQVRGKYVRYLHEDDYLSPHSILDSVKAIEEQNVDFIHGDVIEFYEGSDKKDHWTPQKKNPTLKEMLQKNYLHSASIMYKKELFKKVGLFDESLNTAEEYEFHLRCLKAGLKLGYCNSVLAYYRRHGEQKVRVVPKIEKDKERTQVRKKYE